MGVRGIPTPSMDSSPAHEVALPRRVPPGSAETGNRKAVLLDLSGLAW